MLLVEFLDYGRHAQGIADGAGHTLGHGVGVVEARLVAGDAQRHRLSRLQVALPGQPSCPPAQFGEAHGWEVAQAHQHPAGRAQVEIGAVERPPLSRELDAAPFIVRRVTSAAAVGLECAWLAWQQRKLVQFLGCVRSQPGRDDCKKCLCAFGRGVSSQNSSSFVVGRKVALQQYRSLHGPGQLSRARGPK